MDNLIGKKRETTGKWFFLVCVCLLSAAFLRAQNVRSEEPEQAYDRDGLDYVCVQDAAVALHQDAEWNMPLEEMKMMIPNATAKRRCRPPLVPLIERSTPLGSGMDFDTGYGGMLSRFDGTEDEAVAAVETALKQVGWVETAASHRIRTIKKDTPARVFERDGAWLLTVVVTGKGSADGSTKNSAIFVAGQWRRDILERL